MWKSLCSFLFLIWTFQIDLMDGLKWTTKPPPINKCVGQDVTFMWTFEKEASEEVRQLQFVVNSTKLIAYKSVRNGFNPDPEYQGRVEIINETGLLLKNISAKDTGNYTLYPIIAREENTNIQSIWLNVIGFKETTRKQWCTCESLPLSPEWSRGQSFSIVAEGCHLEISSSFCCPKGPAIEYCESNPQKLCVPIRNHVGITESISQSRDPNILTESTTQSRILPEQTNDKKDPTVVQIGNTQPNSTFFEVGVAQLILTLILVIFCISICILWKSGIILMIQQKEDIIKTSTKRGILTKIKFNNNL